MTKSSVGYLLFHLEMGEQFILLIRESTLKEPRNIF